MVAELHPDTRRRERLGDTDRHDEGLRPVLAVGRLDREAAALAVVEPSRPGPAAAVAHGDPRSLRESPEVLLHLGPGREVRGAIHDRGLQGACLVLVGQEAVPVVPLVGARPTRRRRVRLGPRQQPLEVRPAPEHATRGGILRDDRVLDPVPPQRVRDLESTRPRTDHDHRVRAGRERPGRAGHVPERLAARSRRACAWSMRYITFGWLMRNGSTCGPGRTRQRI